MSSILNKIRKLLAVTVENGATVGEVENAAQMAQILMAKHQIAQGDLIVSKDDIAECGFDDLRVSYEYQNYIWDLLCVIGKGYSCRVTRLKKYHPIKERIVYVFNIIGFPEDVEVVKSMTETLVPIIRAIGRDKTNKFKPVNKRKFYNSYLNGFLMGLDSKLVLSKKEKLTLTDADHQTYAMIVVKKTDLIQEYMDAKTLKTAKSREVPPDMIAVREGFLDGKDFNEMNKRIN